MTPHRRTPARPRATALTRTTALTLSTGLAAALLAGCGVGEGHNDADVAFATQMIPHHAQAVEMAAMVEGEDVSPEVADLAAQISGAQEPEIETMTGWLEEWDEPVPDPDDAMSGDMSGMSGMMSADQMAALEAADGASFETTWLELMLEHHRGAIEMAQAEQAEGGDADAVDLAAEIEAGQAAEVVLMEDLLAQD